jgi:hypothetical protein
LSFRFSTMDPVAHIPFRSLKSDFDHSHFHIRTPLSLRFSASEVTLSGFAGGEYFPLPASKGPAFPSPLTLYGYPTSPAMYAQGQRYSPEIQETPEFQTLGLLPFRFTKSFGSYARLRTSIFTQDLVLSEYLLRSCSRKYLIAFANRSTKNGYRNSLMSAPGDSGNIHYSTN